MNRGERVFVLLTGDLIVGIPLFYRIMEPLQKMEGYCIGLQNDLPAAWLIETVEGCRVFGETIFEHFSNEELGEL